MMKYLFCLCGAAVLGLVFIGFFRLSFRQPKRPITGKYFSRLAALTLALLCLVLLWAYDGALTLTAQMSSVGETAVMFYFGRSADAAAYSTVLNETGEVKFTLPKGVNVRLIRFDPVEGAGDFTLSNMQLQVFGTPVETFSKEQLFDGLNSNNIPVMELTGNGIHFVTEDNDPISILPEAITATLNSYIRIYSVLTLVGSVLLGLLINWIFAGRSIQTFFDKCLMLLREWFKRYEVHPAAMVIAFAHFWFCFYMQHAVFYFEAQYLKNIIFYECLFFVLLQILWQIIFHTVQKVHKRDRATLDFLKFFGIYFSIMFTMLLLIWPGFLTWDEYCEAWRGLHWEIIADYHILVQDPLTLMQMLIPGIAGANLLLCILSSAVVGYVFREIYTRLGRSKWIYLLYIPVALPAVLINNIQWQKTQPGTYLEILLLCKMICAVLDDRALNKKDVIEWSILTAITFVLRTDGSYWIVLGPVLFILLFRKKTKRCVLAALTAGVILCCGVLQMAQNHGTFKEFYTLLNFSRLAYGPITVADPVNDAEELAALNEVFDIKEYQAAGSPDACYAATDSGLENIHSDKELLSFEKNIIKLILKHPGALIHQQIEKLLISSGFGGYLGDFRKYMPDRWGAFSPVFSQNDVYWFSDEQRQVIEEINNNPLNKPIIQELRSKVMFFMLGRDVNDGSFPSIREPIFYNLFPGFVFLLLYGIYLLRRKRYKMLGIYLLFVLRLPIVASSAPYVAFHYYLRFFIVGNAIPFFYFAQYLSRKE